MDGPGPSPASEVPFRISFSGYGGHLRLDPTPHPSSAIPDFVPVSTQPTTSPKITCSLKSVNPKPAVVVVATAAAGLPAWDLE